MNDIGRKHIEINDFYFVVQRGINDLDVKVDILLQGTSISKRNYEVSS